VETACALPFKNGTCRSTMRGKVIANVAVSSLFMCQSLETKSAREKQEKPTKRTHEIKISPVFLVAGKNKTSPRRGLTRSKFPPYFWSKLGEVRFEVGIRRQHKNNRNQIVYHHHACLCAPAQPNRQQPCSPLPTYEWYENAPFCFRLARVAEGRLMVRGYSKILQSL
jgi:hypothetical protein